MTLSDLAAATGFSRTHLNHMELNSYSGGREAWMAAASVLGVSVDFLLSGAVNPPGDDKAIKDGTELALVRWWRTLDAGQRRLVTRMLEPPGLEEAPTRRKSK